MFNLGENNNGFGIGDYMINNSKHEKYNWDSGSFYFGNKFNSSKILHVIVWKSNYWKFYDFNWGTNKKQNC